MNNETTSINVNGIPIDTAVKIRRLAAAETKGKNAPMVVILIQEALRRRNSMLAKEIGESKQTATRLAIREGVEVVRRKFAQPQPKKGA